MLAVVGACVNIEKIIMLGVSCVVLLWSRVGPFMSAAKEKGGLLTVLVVVYYSAEIWGGCFVWDRREGYIHRSVDGCVVWQGEATFFFTAAN